MQNYLDLLYRTLQEGEEKEDRTGTGTFSLFGPQLEFDLTDGLPVVTTKEINLDAVIYELLWFLEGETNVEWLNERGVHIWDDWADEDGEVGPVYGKQWRSWLGLNESYKHAPHEVVQVDQIEEVIDSIENDPSSRRHVVSAWNAADIPDMNLPPCHAFFQFNVVDGEWLDCKLTQRSADAALGVPFNITSYCILTNMVAHVTDLKARRFVHSFGDFHIYKNHVDGVREQIQRSPYHKPELRLDGEIDDIDDFTRDDISVIGYNHHPKIDFEIAV